MENKSFLDPSRKTVGAIYREASKNCSPGETIKVGDLSRELMTSLIEDLNKCIDSNPYNGKQFYITVYEKKDLLMKRAIKREIITTRFRPFPESDTVVFKVTPELDKTEFCWCLPHKSFIYNRINNPGLYEAEEIRQLKAFLNEDYWHFGFCKDEIGNWRPNPNFKDKPLEPVKRVIESSVFCF